MKLKSTIVAAGAVMFSIAAPAKAALITSGAVFPDLTSSGTTDTQISVGFSGSSGSLSLNADAGGNGITDISSSFAGGVSLVIGRAGSPGTVNVEGNGNAKSAQVNLPGSIFVGTDAPNPSSPPDGTLKVKNGGYVRALRGINIAQNGEGYVEVSGPTSLIEINDNALIGTRSGNARVLVEDGATFRSNTGGFIVGENGEVGTAEVTLNNGGNLTGFVDVLDGGRLQGSGGAINGNLFVDGGTVAPGLSPGILSVNGNASLQSGLLELEWDSAGAFDILDISGVLTLGSEFIIELTLASIPVDTLELTDFLSAASIAADAFDFKTQFIASFLPGAGSGSARISFLGETLEFTSDIAEVPLPAAAWLFLAGVAGLATKKRPKPAAR